MQRKVLRTPSNPAGMQRTESNTFGESSMTTDSSFNMGQSQMESSGTSDETESFMFETPPATVDRGTNTGPDAAPARKYGSTPPGAVPQGGSSALPAAPASHGPAVYWATAPSPGGTVPLPTGSPHGDQYIGTPSKAGPNSATSAVGKKMPDEAESENRYGVWLPAITCLLLLMMLVFMTTYLVTTTRPSTSKWTSPPGHVGGLCNASSPCLGHGQCVRDICRCDGPHLTVVAGVCQPTTFVESSTATDEASSEHVTPTSDLDNQTLPTVELFTHERTIHLVTDSATESDMAASDSDEEDIKTRVEEVRANTRVNRTRSSNGNKAQMWITESFKERTQNQSSKRDATRSEDRPMEHRTSWESTNEPTNRRASSMKRSASGTIERSVNGTVGSKGKRSTKIKPGRVRWTSVGPTLEIRRSTPSGGSANETNSGHQASAAVERRENRTAERSPSQTAGHTVRMKQRKAQQKVSQV
ncbi:hypothetical protein HPB51_019669 [Rhipicephalus microplus]|uniref:Uncharacterized protein n=1 Tax=Rhipicephalus microplus TaxID=6941 RepID=A0A9J6EBG7_RHIMP|nr:hypothetical protein HPB51_019669 [Rhipicephalus microplus]